MSGLTIKEGDPVSWQWSGSRPGGTVTEVATDGPITMETKKGNTVEKHGEHDNPALKIEREGHDVVKKASEVHVEKAGETHKEDQGIFKTIGEDEGKEKNGEPQTGEKRAAEEPAEEKEEDDAKKQKTDEAPQENGEQKKRGRPAKGAANGEKKPTKKRAPKKAATATGEPRRSGRNKSS